jgi:transcriptional regulator with XRE-family HTH domain
MSEEISFAGWLRQRRKELSITQEELAERLDISWITLRKLESGERHPSGQVALLLAEHLRVPPDEHQAFVAFARTGRHASGGVNSTAPWRGLLVRQTNLPAMLTSLIGRDKEVEAALSRDRQNEAWPAGGF